MIVFVKNQLLRKLSNWSKEVLSEALFKILSLLSFSESVSASLHYDFIPLWAHYVVQIPKRLFRIIWSPFSLWLRQFLDDANSAAKHSWPGSLCVLARAVYPSGTGTQTGESKAHSFLQLSRVQVRSCSILNGPFNSSTLMQYTNRR